MIDDEFGIVKVCGRVNTRNRLGGYSGYENFRAHFDHNGTDLLVLYLESDESHDPRIFDCNTKITTVVEKSKEPEKKSPLQCYEAKYNAMRDESITESKKLSDHGPYEETDLVPKVMREIIADSCNHTFKNKSDTPQ